MNIDRYLVMSMIRGGVPILGLLLGLFAFLTLAEELEDVGKGNFEVLDAIRVTALSLPKIILELLPVTSLVGVLVGLGALASQQELIALRAAGSSPLRIARPVIMLAVLIGVLALAVQQWLIPALEKPIVDLRSNAIVEQRIDVDTDDDADPRSPGDKVFWTRSGRSMVRIGGVRFGLMPTDIEIHEVDARGHLHRLLQAGRANILGPERWMLQDLRITTIDSDRVRSERLDRLLWFSVLDIDQMATLISAANALPLTELVGYIRHLEGNDLDSHRYRLVLWQQLSLPLGIFGMALLGVPFVLGSTRTLSAGSRIGIGVVLGILFYLLERTTGQLALLYGLPPAPLAIGPDLLIALLAVIGLKRAR